MKFSLGRLLATPGALELLAANSISPLSLLQRHSSGDWGELSAEDVRANERAIKDGSRLLSAYNMPDGSRIWIITEAEFVEGEMRSRMSTCIMMPEEY
jgi:hypothetical protein